MTTAKSKIKSKSHHDAAHLQPLTNVPTKYQLPAPYGCRDIARTRFSKFKIFKIKVTAARSKVKSWSHYCVAHIHLLTNIPSNFLYLTEIQLAQTFPQNPRTRPLDTMGENNTQQPLIKCVSHRTYGVCCFLLFQHHWFPLFAPF